MLELSIAMWFGISPSATKVSVVWKTSPGKVVGETESVGAVKVKSEVSESRSKLFPGHGWRLRPMKVEQVEAQGIDRFGLLTF